jgi:hypothetical protein
MPRNYVLVTAVPGVKGKTRLATKLRSQLAGRGYDVLDFGDITTWSIVPEGTDTVYVVYRNNCRLPLEIMPIDAQRAYKFAVPREVALPLIRAYLDTLISPIREYYVVDEAEASLLTPMSKAAADLMPAAVAALARLHPEIQELAEFVKAYDADNR